MPISGVHTLTLAAHHGLDRYGRSGSLYPDIGLKYQTSRLWMSLGLAVSTRSRCLMGCLGSVTGIESG